MAERSRLGCGGIAVSKIDIKVKQLIEKEGLDNEDLYYADYETFEEIPLFSRWSQIDFLKERPFDDNNLLLISHAITLSENANNLAYTKLGGEHSEYFCCVTLTKWDCVAEINCITPNLYITRRKSWVFSYVKFRQTHSKEELIAKNYIKKLGVSNHGIYISKLVDGNVNRVYIVNEKLLGDTLSG